MKGRAVIGACALAAGSANAMGNLFTEDFAAGDTGGFGSGGGLGGTVTRAVGPGNNPDPLFADADNGFLEIDSTAAPGARLATRAIGVPQYTGDYIAAGVTEISFWGIDTGAPDDAIVRVGIGERRQNFWVSNRSWDLGESWQRFAVDLTDETQWTQVIGGGSFEDALRNTDVLQVRADAIVNSAAPDAVSGSFGIDRIALVPGPGAAGAVAITGLAGVRRRR